jgi:hypothetical protein
MFWMFMACSFMSGYPGIIMNDFIFIPDLGSLFGVGWLSKARTDLVRPMKLIETWTSSRGTLLITEAS